MALSALKSTVTLSTPWCGCATAQDMAFLGTCEPHAGFRAVEAGVRAGVEAGAGTRAGAMATSPDAWAMGFSDSFVAAFERITRGNPVSKGVLFSEWTRADTFFIPLETQ